jgi:hypothetical protein
MCNDDVFVALLLGSLPHGYTHRCEALAESITGTDLRINNRHYLSQCVCVGGGSYCLWVTVWSNTVRHRVVSFFHLFYEHWTGGWRRNLKVTYCKRWFTHVLVYWTRTFSAYSTAFTNFRSRIHERTILLRFLGMILRTLRLEVSLYISETIGKGVWFSFRFPPFSFTVNCNWTVEICKRLREFEDIHKRLCEVEEREISRQSCRGVC